MFPIRINLLPPRKKKRVATLIKFLFLKHIVETILFFVCLGGVTLLLGLYVLEINFNSFAESFVAVNNSDSKSLQEARRANTVINQISAAQKDFIPLSVPVEQLALILPPTITLNSLYFDITKKEAALSGFAANRDVLISFGEEIKKLPWVAAAEIPLNDLVAAGESPFKITISVLPENMTY